jgi:hypothetical protein
MTTESMRRTTSKQTQHGLTDSACSNLEITHLFYSDGTWVYRLRISSFCPEDILQHGSPLEGRAYGRAKYVLCDLDDSYIFLNVHYLLQLITGNSPSGGAAPDGSPAITTVGTVSFLLVINCNFKAARL